MYIVAGIEHRIPISVVIVIIIIIIIIIAIGMILFSWYDSLTRFDLDYDMDVFSKSGCNFSSIIGGLST